MKSTSGQYFIALDHLRALAAFTVFVWHFIHVHDGQYDGPPIFPLSIFTEGHTGVAIFMTLSGYLFARLLQDKHVDFPAFLYNRAVRLLPLLIVVVILAGVEKALKGEPLAPYLWALAGAPIWGTLPNGGWSLTVEAHFYILLPLLLYLLRRNPLNLLGVIVMFIAVRAIIRVETGEVQTLAYLTIIGRIDQFILGILAYHYRGWIAGRHLVTAAVTLAFLAYYYLFDLYGGYYRSPTYPSPSFIWVVMPTIEGFCYAVIIAWYDNSFAHGNGPLSRFVARIGTYSYSIYLIHFFIVFRLAKAIDRHVIDLSNIYVALLASLPAFLLLYPVVSASYHFIEKPFFRFRKPYIIPGPARLN